MKRIRSEHIALEQLQSWEIAEDILPEYSEQQYQDLEEFLATGGQLAPITIAEDFRIVDGYNRWRTAKRLNLDKIECDVYSYDDQSEMEIHAIVLNAKRRHLNRLQVARAAARLTALLPPAEPMKKKRVPDGEEISENDPESESTNVSHPTKTARTVSQKLGVLPSTVHQVSKVDNSGNEKLISAMEKKLISIKHASEIAEMNDEERRQAIEAIDDEKKARANSAEMVCRTCNDCLKKLQSCKTKFDDAEFSEPERNKMKSWITQVISEANSLMEILSKEITESEDSDNTN
jgi:ParB-like chromosome segregation protein Spo0J